MSYIINNSRGQIVAIVADGTVNTTGQTRYMPLYLPTGTLNTIGIRTGSTFSGTGSIRVGLFGTTNGKPANLLVDGGLLSPSASSSSYSTTVNLSVSAGLYWVAFNIISNPATPSYTATSTTSYNSLLNTYWAGKSGDTNITLDYWNGWYENADATSGFSNANPTSLTGAVGLLMNLKMV